MTSLLPIMTLGVSFLIPLLPIITIITYYYVFESEQLANEEQKDYAEQRTQIFK